jgi:tRNA(Ser,Leu) C12 N-acetylase TAN1|tara:strand:+ start:1582 stop:1839 length:258 start_codon:yes stop_codon:yes gene_type:complete
MESNKLDAEELVQLKKSQQEFINVRLQVGDVEINLNRLEQKKKSLLFDVENKGTELQTYVSSLREKYGSADVNMETGELVMGDDS